MAKFLFGIPGRGGWLTVANCLFWAALFLLPHDVREPPPGPVRILVIGSTVAFALPTAVAWPSMLPHLGRPHLAVNLVDCIAIGVNAAIWGYGISFLVRRLRDPDDSSNVREDDRVE